MSNIFLSHTSIDKPFVRKLAADLRNNGHTVWIDEAEINIGDSLISKIREGLDAADYIAVVLSKASVQSEWVKKELEIASTKEIKSKKKIVLPLIIENVDLPGFLEGKLYGDFSDENNYGSTLSLLLRALGDSRIVLQTNEELVLIKEELAQAKYQIKQHQEKLDRIVRYQLSSKSKNLQQKIDEENAKHPDFAPINNVYAIEIGDFPVTLSYLLHVIAKRKFYGPQPLEALISMYDKWNDIDRMLEAYSDMVEAK